MSSEEMNILVTGGAGFIGTHTVLVLLKQGFRISIIDNLQNSCEEAINRVRELAGPDLSKKLDFNVGDLRNKDDIEKLFSKNKYAAVIHFADEKAFGTESVIHSFPYVHYCWTPSKNLLNTMDKHDCKKLIFSSSAAVYGQPENIICVEDSELKPINHFGKTKLLLENRARLTANEDPEWSMILLRYFNPVAAHEGGTLGEDPKDIPDNLMPNIQQVAVGRRNELNVYGHDYPTKDGTAVRDYIHVMDLAEGHVAALKKLLAADYKGCTSYNMGTGHGTSVLETVAAFEKATRKKIPVKMCPRRPDDATAVYASTEKAEKELGWKARYGIDKMCRDQLNWARKSPWGYNKGKPQ